MKKFILPILITLVYHTGMAQTINWVKNMEGVRNCEGHSIALDAAGNVYTTGYFDSIMDFDPGPGTYTLASAGGNEIFISKLNANGGFVWAKSFGGLNGNGAGDVIKIDHSGNIIIAGLFYGSIDFDPGAGTQTVNAVNGDMFVLKLNSSGNYIWAKSMGGPGYTEGKSISIDPSNNVLITGHFTSTADFDPGTGVYMLTEGNINGHGDTFIMKLDSAGNFNWANRFGINEISMSSDVATDNSGNVYTTGYYKGLLDFDPGAGSYVLSSPSHANAFILKLDGSGQFQWAKQFGDTTVECFGNGIAVDYNNNVYTTGYFSGTKDFDPGSGTYLLTAPGTDLYISKLDNAGNFVWAKNTSATYGVGQSIGLDNLNNLYIIGKYVGSSDIDSGPGTYMFSNVQPTTLPIPGIFFLKVGFSGLVKAAVVVGPGWSEQGMGVAVDATGNVHATGYFQGSNGVVDFDIGPLTYTLNSTDRNTNFILKLKPMGNTVGMEELSNNPSDALIVYPNPNNGSFVVHAEENMKLHLINNLGEILQNIEIKKEVNQTIHLETISSGIYFLVSQGTTRSVKQKIIVTR
ncbi:MAG: SBBP repeat-containing protein [Bacteroidota bacterium]